MYLCFLECKGVLFGINENSAIFYLVQVKCEVIHALMWLQDVFAACAGPHSFHLAKARWNGAGMIWVLFFSVFMWQLEWDGVCCQIPEAALKWQVDFCAAGIMCYPLWRREGLTEIWESCKWS